MKTAPTITQYRAWFDLDLARARHLASMLRVGAGQPFAGSDSALREYSIACRRARQWARRIALLRGQNNQPNQAAAPAHQAQAAINAGVPA